MLETLNRRIAGDQMMQRSRARSRQTNDEERSLDPRLRQFRKATPTFFDEKTIAIRHSRHGPILNDAMHELIAPDAPDDYPYVCTFPGHWQAMRGVLTVK